MAGISFRGVPTDGSNHLELKILPVLIQYLYWKKDGLHIELLDVWSEPNKTAQTSAQHFEVPYILEYNPHPFYSFRGLKNQMRIRFAVES